MQFCRTLFDGYCSDMLHFFLSICCLTLSFSQQLFAVIIGMPVPMSPIMILWANLIADVPPAIALGVDPAMSDAMSRPPRDPARGIFSRSTLLKLVVYGVSMASITLALLAITIYVVGEDVPDNPETKSHGRALAFVALTSMQLFHAFVAHASSHRLLSREIFSNRYLLGALSGLVTVNCERVRTCLSIVQR
jgi:Ca2+-transporting ATPase